MSETARYLRAVGATKLVIVAPRVFPRHYFNYLGSHYQSRYRHIIKHVVLGFPAVQPR